MAKPMEQQDLQASSQKSIPAPYLPFRTFLSAVESLEDGIPKKIDRTIWRNQSGLVQGQIMMALRFLGLVDDQDQPMPELHDLVENKGDDRKSYINVLLMSAYSALIEHDLTKMTPKMLDDAMDQYNVAGDTKRKAVTFFLRAAKYAEVPMHPLLSSQVRNTGPRKRKAGRRLETDEPDDATFESPSSGSSRTVQLRNGGTVTLKISADLFTLPGEDRQFVFELVDKLQAYAAANPVEEPEGEEE